MLFGFTIVVKKLVTLVGRFTAMKGCFQVSIDGKRAFFKSQSKKRLMIEKKKKSNQSKKKINVEKKSNNQHCLGKYKSWVIINYCSNYCSISPILARNILEKTATLQLFYGFGFESESILKLKLI